MNEIVLKKIADRINDRENDLLDEIYPDWDKIPGVDFDKMTVEECRNITFKIIKAALENKRL